MAKVDRQLDPCIISRGGPVGQRQCSHRALLQRALSILREISGVAVAPSTGIARWNRHWPSALRSIGPRHGSGRRAGCSLRATRIFFCAAGRLARRPAGAQRHRYHLWDRLLRSAFHLGTAERFSPGIFLRHPLRSAHCTSTTQQAMATKAHPRRRKTGISAAVMRSQSLASASWTSVDTAAGRLPKMRSKSSFITTSFSRSRRANSSSSSRCSINMALVRS